MSQQVVVVGAVALGPKAACRLKRLSPDTNVVMFDEGEYISYGGCGIPFYVSGEINNMDDLRSTTYHAIRDPEFFRTAKNVDMRNRTRVVSIDRAQKNVLVENTHSGERETVPYDKLVLGLGSVPKVPPIEGRDLKGVYTINSLEAAKGVRLACEGGKVGHAVIIGGGFIGLEMAVALGDMWGIEVSVVKAGEHIFNGMLSPTLSRMGINDMEKAGVKMYSGVKVLRLEGENGHIARVVTDKGVLDADLVVMAKGAAPNTALAREAGLELAPNGGILVNDRLQTSDPAIYAGGDCVSVKNLITGKPDYFPQGGLANHQGRIIGTNLAGGSSRFYGAVGSWAIKLFKIHLSGVGLSADRARAEGFDAVGVAVEQLDKAHFYPESQMMTLEIVVDRSTRRVLGLQGASEDGSALKARIDAVGTLLQFGKPTLDDICQAEVAYTPPVASAMDILSTVANVADNVLMGRHKAISPLDFLDLWANRAENDVFFLDARPAGGSSAGLQEKYKGEWHAIPKEEISARLNEIPRDRPIALICNSGLRAFEVQLALAERGIANTVNSMGGMQSMKKLGIEF